MTLWLFRWRRWPVFFTVLLLLPALKAQLSAEEAAKANNPLANVKAFNLQNYYSSTNGQKTF
jgi:hypothetical protein